MQYSNIFSRLIHATRYSLEGLYYALRHEQSFRYEAVVFAIIIFLTRSLTLTGAWCVVMSLELVNSAVEKGFDLVDKSVRPEIKAAKDMLSCSVFIAVCFNIVLWLVMLL